MFEIVLRLHKVQMKGYLILHVVHISVTRTIESVIDGLSRGDNFLVMIRCMNPLQFYH